MAAPPSLHLFPPIEKVERRRDDLDELIRKSMDMRPTRPYPRYTPTPKRTASRSRTRTPAPAVEKPEEPKTAIPIKIEFHDLTHPPQQVKQPSEFNPQVMKTDPLPAPPADAPALRRSSVRPAKHSARRTPSARGRNRMSNASSMNRASQDTTSPSTSIPSSTFSSMSSMVDSPVTEPSSYGDIGLARPYPKPELARSASQSSRQRKAITPVNPYNTESDDGAPLPGPPSRQLSSRASHRSLASTAVASPPRRQGSSRASHRPNQSFERNAGPSRIASPAETDSSRSRSSTESSIMKSPEDFYIQDRPIKSMFPTYDPAAAPTQQKYHPKRPVPIHVPFEKVNKPEYSPRLVPEPAPEPKYKDISSMRSLGSLWDAANGQITATCSGSFNLSMFKPISAEDKRGKKITFGPSESQPFYSLSQSHPSATSDEDELHEALIFRHHTSEDDLLPISHMQLQPPPPPSMSRASRSSAPSVTPNEPTCHITTVTPVLATLHALDHAAKTPQAHTLALVDPKAESPAAAKMAARAVKDATERESCTLTWMRSCARTGKYELHHPSLGVFAVQVDGDVKSALAAPNGTKPRAATSISVLNPFASLGETPSTLSPSAAAFPQSSDQKVSEILARLDFNEEVLHIDAGTIQSLGNLYLLDVCVSTLLAVAISESQRPLDPGLIFAAPPPSLALSKSKKGGRMFSYSSTSSAATKSSTATGTSSSLVILPKRSSGGRKGGGGDGRKRTIDWSNASAVMGIEHLADAEDLPRITRGVLGVLGMGFKSALWVLEFGVKISARMVIGLTRLAVKD